MRGPSVSGSNTTQLDRSQGQDKGKQRATGEEITQYPGESDNSTKLGSWLVKEGVEETLISALEDWRTQLIALHLLESIDWLRGEVLLLKTSKQDLMTRLQQVHCKRPASPVAEFRPQKCIASQERPSRESSEAGPSRVVRSLPQRSDRLVSRPNPVAPNRPWDIQQKSKPAGGTERHSKATMDTERDISGDVAMGKQGNVPAVSGPRQWVGTKRTTYNLDFGAVRLLPSPPLNQESEVPVLSTSQSQDPY